MCIRDRTYFYKADAFAKSWAKIRNFATEAGKDPDTLMNGSQLPIMIGKSRAAVESQMMEWLGTEWDYASWSDSTKDSAIIGTVDECVAALPEAVPAGSAVLVKASRGLRLERVAEALAASGREP